MDRERTLRLSLDLLRGFHAAARHLSFTRAAQDLFVTQPAISREVRTLEEQLGTPLFQRANRTLRLTAAGEDLYRAVDEALSVLDEATKRVCARRGTLGVTVSVPFASLWLGPRLPEFIRANPEIDLRIVANSAILDLEREQLDVALRFVPNSNGSGEGKLFDYVTFPVCSPGLARSRPIRALEDLAGHVLLELETSTSRRPWHDWRQWFEAKGIAPVRSAGVLRFSHYDQLIEAARDGAGVAIGKLPHIVRHMRDGEFVAPFGEASKVKLGTLHAVVAPHAPQEAAHAFVDWLRSEAIRDQEQPAKSPTRRSSKR